MKKNEQAVRQLIAKSISFDGYNLSGCETIRDRPFFGDSVYQIGKYTLSVRTQSFGDKISLEFESVCKIGRICFQPYVLTFEEFVKKLNNAANTGSDFIYFEISPVIDWRISCNNCSYRSNDCERLIKDKPKTVMAAVSFDIDDIRRALAEYHGIITKKNGGSSMKTNNIFFGKKFEFGPCKDSNIASTLMGIVVRRGPGESWHTYDPVKNQIKDMANFKFGNFPIYYIPVNKIQPGDLMKIEGKYYWIKEATHEGTFKAVNAAEGRIEEIMPPKSLIEGFDLYTKVVALVGTNAMVDLSGQNVGNNILSAMLLMQWAKNDERRTEFSLDDIDASSYNGLGAMLPFIIAQNGGTFNNILGEGGMSNLPALMMLGGEDSTDSMMQYAILNQLLNNGSNANNPLNGIFPGLGNPQQVQKNAADAVVCDKCGSTYPAGTNFCPKCGVKTHPMGQFCKSCGAQLMPGAAFCHKCGTKVGPAVCPKCGHEVPEDAAFCPKCGTNLKEPVTTVAPTTPVAPVTPVVPTVPATPVTTEAAEEKK